MLSYKDKMIQRLKCIRNSNPGNNRKTHALILEHIDKFFVFENFTEQYISRNSKLGPVYEAVYFLDGVYVGRSKNVKSRAANHILEALGLCDSNNMSKSKHIITTLMTRKLNMKLIDPNIDNEGKIILNYTKEYDLLNNNGVKKGGGFKLEELYDIIKTHNITKQWEYLEWRKLHNKTSKRKLPHYPHHEHNIKWKELIKQAYEN